MQPLFMDAFKGRYRSRLAGTSNGGREERCASNDFCWSGTADKMIADKAQKFGKHSDRREFRRSLSSCGGVRKSAADMRHGLGKLHQAVGVRCGKERLPTGRIGMSCLFNSGK